MAFRFDEAPAAEDWRTWSKDPECDTFWLFANGLEEDLVPYAEKYAEYTTEPTAEGFAADMALGPMEEILFSETCRMLGWDEDDKRLREIWCQALEHAALTVANMMQFESEEE